MRCIGEGLRRGQRPGMATCQVYLYSEKTRALVVADTTSSHPKVDLGCEHSPVWLGTRLQISWR